MPKPTFENLPAVKRAAIIAIAINEFAQHPYAVASVSRVVEQAGIAKGSLYQYFANKQDLFLFLVEYAAQQQLQLLQAFAAPDPAAGFFAQLRQQMSASVQVGAAAPQLAQLIYRAVSDDLSFREQVYRRLQAVGGSHISDLLRAGMACGELDPALDLELALLLINGLISQLGPLIARRAGVSLSAAAEDANRLHVAAEPIYDAVLQLLRFGLNGPRVDERTNQ